MPNERVTQLIIEARERNSTGLNLSGHQLTQLPREIAQLKNLTTLNLCINNLIKLPREIAKLKNLTSLDLSHNQLTQLPAEIAQLKNLTKLDLSWNQLTQLPPEIIQLENLTTFIFRNNQLTQLPPEIALLKNLTTLDLSHNKLTQLPPEIVQLENLTTFIFRNNQLTQLPPEIVQLKNLTTLDLVDNQLTQLLPEITQLINLTILDISSNQLTQLPPEITQFINLTTLNLGINKLTRLPREIAQLKNLTTLNLSHNKLTRLPAEIAQHKDLTILNLSINKLNRLPRDIAQLKNLTTLDLSHNKLTQLQPEIAQLENLIKLDLSYNQLTQLQPEIAQLENLTTLDLSHNKLTQLPPEIAQLENLIKLDLSYNQLTQLPPEIAQLKKLNTLNLCKNSLTSLPPEIVSRGLEAIFTYLKQTRTTENNEAKLLLVGNGDVGKTCLAHRLINDKFLINSKKTEGINITKWRIPAPDQKHNEIKLNIWDFGGQEIYHSTHQFFLTERSVYLLVWNARRSRDYDNIYYWLYTIKSFGGDSPIILVMSKMNEHNDDLNLKDLINKFPQIVGYEKIDSYDGSGINSLVDTIRRIAWDSPLMKVKWVDSWFRVRQKLEKLDNRWISYDKFTEICESERLDSDNIKVLDNYLHDLGVTLHFKDTETLKNIVILKPQWATDAFYKILSTQSVIDKKGELSKNELSKIWDNKIYPSSVHDQLLELMNKFELAYKLPDEKSYLVAELLPKSEPEFKWDVKDNLCFYYQYENFLPASIITRFIVRMHQDIEKKEKGMPLCWREGVVMNLLNSRALVKMKPDERQIEIKIIGSDKRGALGAICNELDRINNSIRKLSVSKEVPCNCGKNCIWRYPYEKLLKAEMSNIVSIQCLESFKSIYVSSLLDGYKRNEERLEEYEKLYGNRPIFIISSKSESFSDSKSITKVDQKQDVKVDINVDLYVDLPQIQKDFDNLGKEIKHLNPDLDSDLDKIQDSLDEVSTKSDQKELAKPFNKLYRFLDKLSDPNSEYNKVITGTQKGIELAQKVGRTYNKFAQWLAMPQVPDLFLGKS